MTKFSREFKLKAVLEYLTSSKGTLVIAKEYHIGSDTTVLKWVKQYQKYGIVGLEVRKPDRIYDGSFKGSVLNWLKTHNTSLTQTALHFNISAPSTIWSWQRKFDQGGIEALYTTRGRPAMPNKSKPLKNPSNNQQQADLKHLQEENELLRIENEYLKKLRALVQSKPGTKPK